MSQDILADALNQIMNAIRANKTSVTVQKHSKLLLSVLALAKLKGYIASYKLDGNSITIEVGVLNKCGSIKPRCLVQTSEIDLFTSRDPPAKGMGTIVVSTSQGIMTHQTAQQKNLGGSLLAYFY